jgi:hypothetical protein
MAEPIQGKERFGVGEVNVSAEADGPAGRVLVEDCRRRGRGP